MSTRRNKPDPGGSGRFPAGWLALGLLVLTSSCTDGERVLYRTEEVPGVTLSIERLSLPDHRYWPVHYRIEAGDGRSYRSEAVYFIDRDAVDQMEFSVKTGLREGEWEVVWENRPPGNANDREFHPFLLVYPDRFWSFPRTREDRAGLGQGFREWEQGEIKDWGADPRADRL